MVYPGACSCGESYPAGPSRARGVFLRKARHRPLCWRRQPVADVAFVWAQALAFAAILPGWEELCGWRLLSASAHLRVRVVIAAADHGASAHNFLYRQQSPYPWVTISVGNHNLRLKYSRDPADGQVFVMFTDPAGGALSGCRRHAGFLDGASHQRRDPYRQSPWDTGVFVLQTSRAARKWPLTEVCHSLSGSGSGFAFLAFAPAAGRRGTQWKLVALRWQGIDAELLAADRGMSHRGRVDYSGTPH